MNKKTKIITIIITLLILTGTVNALGIAPSKKIITNDKEIQNIQIRIINTDQKDMTLKISAEGSLAYLINITEPTIHVRSDESEKEFTYTVNLPQELSPGTKTIIITIAEIKEESQTNAVSGLLTLSHQLMINIPQTGLHAEGHISTSQILNRTITAINIANIGTETIKSIKGTLNIRDLDSKIIYTKAIQEQHNITPETSTKIEETFDLETPGVYIAEYDIDYDGKNIILSKIFSVGDHNLQITGANVKNFKLGTIAKLDVEIKNNWNAPINNVYGEITITDMNGTIIGKTNTTKTTINATTGKITAYWDTTNIKTGQYTLNLKLHAGEKTITKNYTSTIDNNKIIIGTQNNITKTNNILLTISIILFIIITISLTTRFLIKHKRI